MLQPRSIISSHRQYSRCITSSLRNYATTSQTVVANLEAPPIPPPAPFNQASSGNGSDSRISGDHRALLKTFTPRTPGLRHLKQPINNHLWKGAPHRELTFPKMGHAKGGRNNGGKVTVRHHGGGARRRIRMVDFTRMEPGEQVVDRIEYDPNRSAHLALITHKKTGEKNYIIAPEGLRAGDVVTSYRAGIPEELIKSMGGHIDPGVLAAKTAFRGNCLPLHLIPPGTQVHCVGFLPERRAIFCRSAGTFATVIGKDEAETVFRHMIVRLQSGEIRKVHKDACATIGTVSNPMYQFRQLGKAGRSRWLNIRPTVRGLAMNAVDHPHGGGRGKSKGNRIPVSPWGTPAKSGYKTRQKSKVNKWLVTPRERNHGKRRTGKS